MEGSIARVSGSDIKGQAREGATAWLGMRYAMAERFGRPQLCVPGPGAFEAITFGSASPQRLTFNTLEQIGPAMDEDCLYLNVFSPAADGRRRPVMVWIHGGAFVGGSAALYDGTQLAREGDIVIVAINYRLGLLGFMTSQDPDIPANLGLLDQIAALQWVKDNIAAFGGDPDRVTIAGESAGSLSISLLMQAKQADGLYHAAILQSGASNLIYDAARARQMAERCRAMLAETGLDMAHIRTVPVETILQMQDRLDDEFPGMAPAGPFWDGDLLPASLEEARQSPTAPVPAIVGHMRDEGRIFELKQLQGILPLERETLDRLLVEQMGDDKAAQISGYYAHGKAGRRALASDMHFGMPARHFAERHSSNGARCWFYRFDLAGLLLGAPHGLDLAYLWGWGGFRIALMAGAPMMGKRKAAGRRMRDFWINFIRNHNPGDAWPEFKAQQHSVYVFDKADHVLLNPDEDCRRAWNGQDVAVTALNVANSGG